MKITNVRIFKAKKRGPVLAYANVILSDQFIIRGITLLENERGRFISMPSRKLEERQYRDMCHPLNSKVREELTEKVFAAYDKLIANEE
ncbi:MAG: septation protein SpoVG [Clostridia bacterium]|nr:septation protein SpoVG [Clostridia bacterium]